MSSSTVEQNMRLIHGKNNMTKCEDLQDTFEFSIVVFEAKQGHDNNLPFCFDSFRSKESALMVFDTRVIFLLAVAAIEDTSIGTM